MGLAYDYVVPTKELGRGFPGLAIRHDENKMKKSAPRRETEERKKVNAGREAQFLGILCYIQAIYGTKKTVHNAASKETGVV